MTIKPKTATLLAAAGALAIAVPAAAHSGPSSHTTGKSQSSAHTKRCAPHKRAYIVSGVITDGTGMNLVSGDTWSGSLTYTVTHTNHYARRDQGTATFTNPVKVQFDGGTTDFTTTPNEQVKLIGKIEWVRTTGHNKCDNAGPQGNPSFRMLVVSPPAS